MEMLKKATDEELFSLLGYILRHRVPINNGKKIERIEFIKKILHEMIDRSDFSFLIYQKELKKIF